MSPTPPPKKLLLSLSWPAPVPTQLLCSFCSFFSGSLFPKINLSYQLSEGLFFLTAHSKLESVHAHTLIDMCTNTSTHTYHNTPAHLHLHTCLHTYIHVHTHLYMHVHTQTHIYLSHHSCIIVLSTHINTWSHKSMIVSHDHCGAPPTSRLSTPTGQELM